MATQKLDDATGKMTKLCRKIVCLNIQWTVVEKMKMFRQLLRFIWGRILVSSTRMHNASYSANGYCRLSSSGTTTTNYNYNYNSYSSSAHLIEYDEEEQSTTRMSTSTVSDNDTDLVSLKIILLGDSQIGKTTFLKKYVGKEEEKRRLEMKGINLMNKTMYVQGATIAFRFWDIGGDKRSFDQVPIACRGAVAILFMFDLTNRCTLNSIIGWYSEARKWNQNAIPILIGTKFDDFAQLPHDIQWTIVSQARAYARAMKATLFFSSATHNINVNKIFKFIMAKLFDSPWTIQRNLTIGEPIIDF